MALERLLHIDASPRAGRSRSRVVAGHFVMRLAERQPGLTVERLDLWDVPLPSLADGMIEGRYALIMGGEVDPDIRAAWDEVGRHADHFLSFDAYVISTPMWNFGIPYPLKHYVDVVTQPRMAFTNDAHGHITGHAAGKKAMIVAASAMDIQPQGPLAGYDFQLNYLTTWLQFIGITDIAPLRVAPTFGPSAAVEAAMATAMCAAEQMAEDFC